MTAETLLLAANASLTTMALVAALFFLRHWRTTHDRLFVFFAVAFVGLAVQWAAPMVWPWLGEHDLYVYGVRFLAFLALALGIADKNRAGGR